MTAMRMPAIAPPTLVGRRPYNDDDVGDGHEIRDNNEITTTKGHEITTRQRRDNDEITTKARSRT